MARQHRNLRQMKMECCSLRELETFEMQKARLRVPDQPILSYTKSKTSNTTYQRLGVASLHSKPCQWEGIKPRGR